MNTDGAAKGALGLVGGGGIFRHRSAAMLGCFPDYYGIESSFHAEVCMTLSATEIAHNRGWRTLWLEYDFALVMQAMSGKVRMPWKLTNKWRNCSLLIRDMNLKVTHIFREWNSCVDSLAAFGVSSKSFTWWDLIPASIRQDFFRDRLGLPNYRFNQW
ncbi:PREDICTED: uncharacterized protein LOC109350497 [Lupinus angustifolius]|uniref:uncharacterized protein LOC109350497 n=1 Tax=Lupinus angustifolius TaxID=3871 RepID=UPI00092ED12B|nr:PREDICTED: uncharacterized protein LOC109350497 [Lupinus angustifolius]